METFVKFVCSWFCLQVAEVPGKRLELTASGPEKPGYMLWQNYKYPYLSFANIKHTFGKRNLEIELYIKSTFVTHTLHVKLTILRVNT
jgi:hypothetical protein